jgi:hypothetical protein
VREGSNQGEETREKYGTAMGKLEREKKLASSVAHGRNDKKLLVQYRTRDLNSGISTHKPHASRCPIRVKTAE